MITCPNLWVKFVDERTLQTPCRHPADLPPYVISEKGALQLSFDEHESILDEYEYEVLLSCFSMLIFANIAILSEYCTRHASGVNLFQLDKDLKISPIPSVQESSSDPIRYNPLVSD